MAKHYSILVLGFADTLFPFTGVVLCLRSVTALMYVCAGALSCVEVGDLVLLGVFLLPLSIQYMCGVVQF